MVRGLWFQQPSLLTLFLFIMVYQETFSEDFQSKKTTRDAEPQVSFRAKVRRDTFLSDMFLGLDAAFTRYGAVRVEINDTLFFESQQDAAFRRYQTYPLGTQNKVLRNGERVKVWLWSLTGDDVKLTVTFSVSVERFESGKSPDAINELTVARLLSTNPQISTDTRAITDSLQSVRDAFDESPDDILTLTTTKNDLMTAMESATGEYQNGLISIVESLQAAENDFNQNTLEALILAISENLELVRANNADLATKLEAAQNNLNQIHETAPILRSSDETSLFPHELLNNEEHTALLNLLGAKNMIIVINAAAQNDYAKLVDSSISGYTTSDIPVNSNNNLPTQIYQRIVYDLLDQNPKELVIRINDAQQSGRHIRYFYRCFDRFRDQFNSQEAIPFHCYENRIYHELNLKVEYRIRFGDLRNFPDSGFQQGISNSSAENIIQEDTILNHNTSKRYMQIDKTLQIISQRIWEAGTHEFQRCPVLPTSDLAGTDNCSRLFWQAIPVPAVPPVDFSVELSDTLRTGGSIELSGEVRDSLGEWHEYITSQEIGGVFPNDSPTLLTAPGERTIQFGEALNLKILPSSDRLFRLRLKVTGAAEVSVDIIRVL